MKHRSNAQNSFFAACLAAAAFLVVSLNAEATTRKVYFNQSGRNVSDKGMGSSAQSSCRITLSNPSSQSQDYVLNITASISGTAAAAPTATTTTSEICASASSSGSSTNFSCSGTLAAAGTVTKTIMYPAFPANTAGVQTLICAGYVQATDSGSTPGFLAASGNLITFTESGSVDTTASTGSTTFNGYAIYTQLPIQINRGKPF